MQATEHEGRHMKGTLAGMHLASQQFTSLRPDMGQESRGPEQGHMRIKTHKQASNKHNKDSRII